MGKKEKLMQKEFDREKAWNTLAKPGCHEFVVVLDHLKPDFNVGKIIRSADAFGCFEIHLVGIPFFSPSPAKGSFRHVPAKFYNEFAESYADLKSRGYTFFVFEPRGGTALYEAKLPSKSAFIVGHEFFGMSFQQDQYEGIQRITIPQFGKVESLNVSIAASLAMYEYIRQNARFLEASALPVQSHPGQHT